MPIIFAPWGHGKSTLLSIGLPLWYIAFINRNARVKVVCNIDPTSTDRVNGMKMLYEKSSDLRRLAPWLERDTKNAWGAHELWFTRGPGVSTVDPSVQAKGVFSTGIAGRADLLVFDDVPDFKNTIEEPGTRHKVSDAVNNTWLSRLEPNGKVVWVCTAWATDDASFLMAKKSNAVTLIQRVTDDMEKIECEIINAGEDYPVPKAA